MSKVKTKFASRKKTTALYPLLNGAVILFYFHIWLLVVSTKPQITVLYWYSNNKKCYFCYNRRNYCSLSAIPTSSRLILFLGPALYRAEYMRAVSGGSNTISCLPAATFLRLPVYMVLYSSKILKAYSFRLLYA